MGEILERHGIYVHHMPYATEVDLEAKLSASHGVVVGVDADEIWKLKDDVQMTVA